MKTHQKQPDKVWQEFVDLHHPQVNRPSRVFTASSSQNQFDCPLSDCNRSFKTAQLQLSHVEKSHVARGCSQSDAGFVAFLKSSRKVLCDCSCGRLMIRPHTGGKPPLPLPSPPVVRVPAQVNIQGLDFGTVESTPMRTMKKIPASLRTAIADCASLNSEESWSRLVMFSKCVLSKCWRNMFTIWVRCSAC